MEAFIDFLRTKVYYHGIRRIIPKYRGYTIFRPMFWRLIKDKLIYGYNDADTWCLYYTLAKYIYPRLTRFFDVMDNAKALPQYYENRARDDFIRQGYKYDYKQWHRFVDKSTNKEAFEWGYEMWKNDIFKMMEAFRDIIYEEDHYEDWERDHKLTVELSNKIYKNLKTDKEREQFWNSLGLSRKWRPGYELNVWDFAERKRRIGLQLFSKHFQSLWW